MKALRQKMSIEGSTKQLLLNFCQKNLFVKSHYIYLFIISKFTLQEKGLNFFAYIFCTKVFF
jgi:hypothetical protein